MGKVHLAPQDAADLQPIDCRQHEVQDHQVRAFCARERDCLVTIAGSDDVIAFALEVVLQRRDQRRLIVDDEDGLAGCIHESIISPGR